MQRMDTYLYEMDISHYCNKRVRDTEELTKHDKACSITGHVIDSCYLKQYYYFFSIFCK